MNEKQREAIEERAERLRRRQYDRADERRLRRLRQADREAFGGSADGRALSSSPLDRRGIVSPQPIGRVSAIMRQHSIWLEATTDVPAGGGTVRWQQAGDSGITATGFDGVALPTSSVSAELTGLVQVTVEGRWLDERDSNGDLVEPVRPYSDTGAVTISVGGRTVTQPLGPQGGETWRVQAYGMIAQRGDQITVTVPNGSGAQQSCYVAAHVEIEETQPSAVTVTTDAIIIGVPNGSTDTYVAAVSLVDGSTRILWQWTGGSALDTVLVGDGTMWTMHGGSSEPNLQHHDIATGTVLDSYTYPFPELRYNTAALAYRQGLGFLATVSWEGATSTDKYHPFHLDPDTGAVTDPWGVLPYAFDNLQSWAHYDFSTLYSLIAGPTDSIYKIDTDGSLLGTVAMNTAAFPSPTLEGIARSHHGIDQGWWTTSGINVCEFDMATGDPVAIVPIQPPGEFPSGWNNILGFSAVVSQGGE